MHTDLEFKWPGQQWFGTCYKSWSALGTCILCGKTLWNLVNLHNVRSLLLLPRFLFLITVEKTRKLLLVKLWTKVAPGYVGIWRQEPQGVGYQNHLENCQSTDCRGPGAPLGFLVPGGEFAFPEFLVTAGEGLRVSLTAAIGNTVSSIWKVTLSFCFQTESPLLVQPYLPHVTRSELHAIMTAGFATIAGSVLGAYISFGVRMSGYN